MNQAGKKQQGFRMPHVFIILLFIMLFVVVLSYIIPSGSYQRLQDASGITVIDPNTFQYVENETPIGFMDYFEAIYTGFVNGATIMGTLFISSGAIYLLEVSGAFGVGINLILKKTRGKEFSVVCIFYTIFVVFGVLGYGEAAYPFYPLAVTIGFALGYDRMVGTAFAILGSTVGFTSGLMNTFTTGVAQQIVGLPLFSGIGFRAVDLAVFYIIGLIGLYAYCRKIKKDPSASLLSQEYIRQSQEDHAEQTEEMNVRRALGLLVFLGVVVAQGIGCIRFGWSFPQIAGIYVIMAFLLATIFPDCPQSGMPTVLHRCCACVLRSICGRFGTVRGYPDESGMYHRYDRARHVAAFGTQERDSGDLRHLRICHTFQFPCRFRQRKGRHYYADSAPARKNSEYQSAGLGSDLSVRRQNHQ